MDTPIRHRTSGNVCIPTEAVATPMDVGPAAGTVRSRITTCQHFRVGTPDGERPPRAALSPSRTGNARQRLSATLGDRQLLSKHFGEQLILAPRWVQVAAGLIVLVSGVFGASCIASWLATTTQPFDAKSIAPGLSTLEEVYAQKLESIAASVSSLQGLSEVVVRADTAYEEVYHNQLVRRGGRQPDEAVWNSFVDEARVTAPVFLEGKEKLRDAVANLHRLIRRAPEFLRNLLHWVAQQNRDEAAWYLDKVIKLVESVHASMEAAAKRFAEVDIAIEGMTHESLENEEHLAAREVQLQDDVTALEDSASPTSSGSWMRATDQALSGCQLEASRVSLKDCKSKCLQHFSGSCDRFTYYKTAHRSNCYLHCASAVEGNYKEADTYRLERAPRDLAADLVLKRRAGDAASRLKLRWRDVRGPLREVAQLVRRFRAASADLRHCLEEVRFAADDLKAVFMPAASEAGITAEDSSSGRTTSPHELTAMKLLERRVADVIASVEDLGHSLAGLRFGATSS